MMFGVSVVDETFAFLAVSPPNMADERRPEPWGSGGGAGFARSPGDCSAIDGVPDEPFLPVAVALEAGAKLALSTSIADGSAVLGGWGIGFGVVSTVGSTDVLACADEDPGVNCWKEGGVGFGLGGRNRELGSCAFIGCDCGSVRLDITGDALARNNVRGGVGSMACLCCRLGVDGADIVMVDRTGS